MNNMVNVKRSCNSDEKPYSYRRSLWNLFCSDKVNIVLLAVLFAVMLFAFIYPLFSDYDRFANIMIPDAKHLSSSAAIEKYGFSMKWILGTGANGESVFDSVWYGARISLLIAFICSAVNMILGITAGLIWGITDKTGRLMLQIYYVIGNVPHILIVSVIMMIMGSSFASMIVSLTAAGWLNIAYEIRNQVLIIKNREYNMASVGLGTPLPVIIRKNILPHLISVIFTILSQEIPSYISYEVFLSYIGIGIPEMSLGKLIYEAEKSMFVKGWMHEFWWPVALVCIITFTMYVLGQHLGDASDPKNHM